jgi:hypothetical protein
LRGSGIDRTLAPINRAGFPALHIVEMVVPPGGFVIRFTMEIKLVREMKALVRTGEKK